ncbi:hypothetical protein T265_15700, partial [Opisthorchis viverrini]
MLTSEQTFDYTRVLDFRQATQKPASDRANVFHTYLVLRANKIPAENIITFAYDDIANNPKNPFPGQVFNDYELENVYKDVVIDYRRK